MFSPLAGTFLLPNLRLVHGAFPGYGFQLSSDCKLILPCLPLTPALDLSIFAITLIESVFLDFTQ